jgi:acetyl esterase/lipase
VVFAGEKELLRTEVDRLQQAANRAQVPISVHLVPRMWHGWYVMADRLPEGRRVLESAGQAIRESVASDD